MELPDNHWLQLAKLLAKAEHKILIPWNNQNELARANYIAQNCDNAYVMPKMNLATIANLLINAKGVISIDTGLAHLAAALNVPTITLYGPTNPQRVGTIGVKQEHIIANYECKFCDKPTCKRKKSKLNSACLATITPQTVSNLITT
jgi:heptosyltransferase-1